ncbi:hypothetical protein AVEN_47212-1 [Araneus ventricosus]|uniref:Uncharacterized protein n=1 Tax=Araneus ventricosus TaxID=182803 RepID=A0A4Y2X7Q4_ARAVE|nr:hypothetical protein AVEN_47212-1 [Araneus ventricosus]
MIVMCVCGSFIPTEGRVPKEEKKLRHSNTKKKRMVLWVMAIKPITWKHFCWRHSSDREEKMEFKGLLESWQVVESTAQKEERGLAKQRNMLQRNAV